MDNKYSVFEIVELLIGKWKVVFAIPVLLSIIAYGAVGLYDDKFPRYEAKTTIALASKYSDVKRDESKIPEEQLRQYAQLYNEQLIETMKGMITSSKVIADTVKLMEGEGTYNNRQLYNEEVPALRKLLRVDNGKDSMLITLSVNAKNPERAARVANNLISSLQAEEKRTWGSNNIKVINKSVPPFSSNGHSAIKYALITFGIFFVVTASLIILRDSADR